MNLNEVVNQRFKRSERTYAQNDSILYAIGVGFASRPLDPAHLAYLYEEQLVASPTLANVLGFQSAWVYESRFQINWKMALHGEQRLTIHAPLPAAGRISLQNEIMGVRDRGPKGAVLHQRNRVFDAESGAPLATLIMTAMLRGDHNSGDWGEAPHELPGLPGRPCDHQATFETYDFQNIVYRLTGDINPVHIDPAVAQEAGFEQPILHGLATKGIAGYMVLREFCAMDAVRLKTLSVRFTQPVVPGDRIQFQFWEEGPQTVLFRASLPDRGGIIVLDRGVANIS